MANRQLKITIQIFFFFSFLFSISIAAIEKSIVVIIPSYNNKDWLQRNLDSIVSQDYTNFRVVYIDDASTDGTAHLVENYIHKNKVGHLVTLIKNEKRNGALSNIYNSVSDCAPTDIIVTVDGDDWLYHEGVLQRINDVYNDPNVWITYGQKIEYPTEFSGGAALIPYDVIQQNSFREHEWVTTHLRTFYAGLFQKIKKEDFLYNGNFFPVAWDLAFMFPMLEMAGIHSRFISDILYVYNVETPLNDRKLHLEQQMFLDSYIRMKPRYTPIDTPYDNRPIVTCDLRGGLGNQLFQIASTLAYAWDYDARAIFPDLNRHEVRIEGNKDKIFFRLESGEPSRTFQTKFQESSWHSSDKIPFQSDLKLFGYFQSWKHFDHHREAILNTLAPSDKIILSLFNKYSDLIQTPNTVAIHIRTFNEALHNSKHHPFLGLEYYEKAMAHFPPESTFVVFSDRINWCKKHFPKLGKNVVFIEGNDPVEDLFLMSMMKHNIICNSTFSWWGAYLNQNAEKIVIAPIHWMHPDIDPFSELQPNEFYLPEWRVVSPNYSAPYPNDITLDDTSIDDSLFK